MGRRRERRCTNPSSELSRRDFVALSVAGLAATARSAPRDTTSPRPRSSSRRQTAPATARSSTRPPVHTRPSSSGRTPGLRVSMREMAKRLAVAATGARPQSVLPRGEVAGVWRHQQQVQLLEPDRPQQADAAHGFDYADGAAERDAVAFVAWLDKAEGGRHVEEDRDAGLLHGWSARVPHGGSRSKTASVLSVRSMAAALVTDTPNKPAPAHSENARPLLSGHRVERRSRQPMRRQAARRLQEGRSQRT